MQRVCTTNVRLQWAGNRHGFSCLCLRKHLEECSLPGGWDISTCKHFSHYKQQSVQKIIRRMFQKFSNKSQIITALFALQAGYSMLQFCHCPRRFGQCRHSHGRSRITMEQMLQHFCRVIDMRLICNFMARRAEHAPQHLPR